jgi:hypothetical protein
MPVAIIPAAIAAFQVGKGLVDEHNAKQAAKAAQAQIKPYKTPQEVYDVLNATKYNAQSGFDTQTLDYLTNQTDSAFASSLGTAEMLGADPNALSAIFGQKINGIMQISAQNHQLQTQNFSAYLNALNAVGAGNAAEQKSVQDQLKDQLQKIGIDKAVSTQQISAGLNTALSTISNAEMMKLYKEQGAVSNTFIPQKVNANGYLTNPITSQSLQQTGLQIPQ